jgi:hypothetical protein
LGVAIFATPTGRFVVDRIIDAQSQGADALPTADLEHFPLFAAGLAESPKITAEDTFKWGLDALIAGFSKWTHVMAIEATCAGQPQDGPRNAMHMVRVQ